MRADTAGTRPHTWLRLPGKITISKPINHEPPMVTVSIVDDLSHCVAVELAMPLEDFARALFGQGYIGCTIGVNVSGVLGKRAEVRTIAIATPRDLLWKNSQRDQVEGKLDALVQPHEIDGWVAEMADFFNPHRYGERVAGDGDRVNVNVTFRRFVELTPEETEASLAGLTAL